MTGLHLASAPAAAPLLRDRIVSWYEAHRRDLPWRRPGCSPWGVLVSEVMLQQTPVVRVLPVWQRWMELWPTPTHLAGAAPGDAVRAWDRLGYPRRALRLHAAATMIAQDHGGEVPRTEAALRTLPGVGDYTAAAVAAFAFGQRTIVVDTNVRRVQARLLTGDALPAPSLSRAEVALAATVLPAAGEDAATWSVSVMELGALICTARAPQCPACPVADLCRWRLAGSPAYAGPPRQAQTWEGTDRQCRGRMVQLLREAEQPVQESALHGVWDDRAQSDRCLDGLVADGLVEPRPDGSFTLPG